MALTEERKGQIALAAKKADLRKSFSLRDIASLKREIGNAVKEQEMEAIKASPEELIEFAKGLLEEIFTDQMKAV